MLTGGNKVYSEVEGMQLLLQYQVRRSFEYIYLIYIYIYNMLIF